VFVINCYAILQKINMLIYLKQVQDKLQEMFYHSGR